jgi:hypothetical protein
MTRTAFLDRIPMIYEGILLTHQQRGKTASTKNPRPERRKWARLAITRNDTRPVRPMALRWKSHALSQH